MEIPIPDPRELKLVPLPDDRRQKEDGIGWEPGHAGRGPEFLKDDVRRRILAYVQAGTSRAVAARAIGVKKETFYSWVKRAKDGDEPYATFMAEVEEYEAICEASLVASVAIAARRDPAIALKLLRARFPERWNEDKIAPENVDVEPIRAVEDLPHLSEIMAAYEEAGIVPDGHVVVEADG